MNQPIHIHELFTYEKVSTRDYKLKAKPLPELIGYEPKTPTPNQIKVNGKTLDTYSDVLFVIRCYSNTRDSEVPSEVKISTTGFLTQYMNRRRITKCIKSMNELGIIRVVSDQVITKKADANGDLILNKKGKPTYSGTTSRSYVWYPANEFKIKKILTDKGIEPMTPQFNDPHKTTAISDDKIRFSSFVRFKRPTDMEPMELTSYINARLSHNYPILPIIQSKVALINSHYVNKPERIIHYTPTVHYSLGSKWVSGIGIRYFCDFCSYSKEKKDYIPYRNDYLFSEGLDLHYDVKGSVPKISSLINFGTWSDNSEDPYKLMSDAYNKISGELDNPWDSRQRAAIKDIFVRVYFERSVATATNNALINIKNRGQSIDKEELSNYLSNINKAITSCFGKSLGSEIFFHESNVYILALEQLLNDGFDVVTCFDSFYAHKKGVNQKDFDSYMDKLLEDCAFKYLEMLHQHKGTF